MAMVEAPVTQMRRRGFSLFGSRPNWKRHAVFTGVAILVLLISDYWLFPLLPFRVEPLVLPSNGVWLGFDYAAGRATETPAVLGARLRANHVREAYFHVRYIGQSGRLRYDVHGSARELNRRMAKDAPDVRRLAWVFIGNERAITGVDLSKAEVRARIAQACSQLVFDDGFDGVQIDYEICADGDADFLRLLGEIRRATPGKRLSVATPLWLPLPVGPHGWSEGYFAQVARLCDQVAVMGYDSGLYSPRLYVYLIARQVVHVSRAMAGTDCRVVIGVPTYAAGGVSHDAHTETLANALRGVQEGLRGNPFADRVEGVACFADYTTDADEWKTWRRRVR